jgi:hypothetical protein
MFGKENNRMYIVYFWAEYFGKIYMKVKMLFKNSHIEETQPTNTAEKQMQRRARVYIMINLKRTAQTIYEKKNLMIYRFLTVKIFCQYGLNNYIVVML